MTERDVFSEPRRISSGEALELLEDADGWLASDGPMRAGVTVEGGYEIALDGVFHTTSGRWIIRGILDDETVYFETNSFDGMDATYLLGLANGTHAGKLIDEARGQAPDAPQSDDSEPSPGAEKKRPGRPPAPDRQQIEQAIRDGLSNPEIAQRFSKSEGSVRIRRYRFIRKTWGPDGIRGTGLPGDVT